MGKNERGFTILPVLFITATLLLYVVAQLPKTIDARENLRHEWGKLQAERNAEAGVYLALNAWKEDPDHFVGDLYVLSNGQALATVEKEADVVIKIVSIGLFDSIYEERLSVLYNLEQDRWIDWTG